MDLIERTASNCLCTLYGTLTAVDYEAETCSLSLETGDSLSGVPIHYHCKGESTIEGGSMAFDEGDEVKLISLTNPDTGNFDASNTFVVGFKDGNRRSCVGGCFISNNVLGYRNVAMTDFGPPATLLISDEHPPNKGGYASCPDVLIRTVQQVFPQIFEESKTNSMNVKDFGWNPLLPMPYQLQCQQELQEVTLPFGSHYSYAWIDEPINGWGYESMNDPHEHLLWMTLWWCNYNYGSRFNIAILPNTRVKIYAPLEAYADDVGYSDSTHTQSKDILDNHSVLVFNEVGPKIINFTFDDDYKCLNDSHPYQYCEQNWSEYSYANPINSDIIDVFGLPINPLTVDGLENPFIWWNNDLKDIIWGEDYRNEDTFDPENEPFWSYLPTAVCHACKIVIERFGST